MYSVYDAGICKAFRENLRTIKAFVRALFHADRNRNDILYMISRLNLARVFITRAALNRLGLTHEFYASAQGLNVLSSLVNR